MLFATAWPKPRYSLAGARRKGGLMGSAACTMKAEVGSAGAFQLKQLLQLIPLLLRWGRGDLQDPSWLGTALEDSPGAPCQL